MGDLSAPASDPADSPLDVTSTKADLENALRTVAAGSAAGALLGVLVGGVGGRSAMALLAAQNPEDTGRISDDGFRIGQFTVGGTIQLLAASLQLGLLGALIYLVLRRLAIGPRWLRVASLTAGGAVVFEAALLNPDGVDFTILDPDWLPVVLFIMIPATFVLLLSLLAEHWLAPDSWFATAPLRRVGAVLLVWIPTGPLLVLLAAALGVGVIWRRLVIGFPERAKPAVAWTARALVGILGVFALVSLVTNVDAVT